MPSVAALPGRLIILAVVVGLHLVPGVERASAQGQPAVVEGTTKLFIRRGPGREFPPFATLTGGSKVQLHEKRGTWSRITTASGQVGYVHSKFLRVVDSAGATPPAATPADTPASEPPPATPTMVAATQPPSPRPTATKRRAGQATASPAENVPTPNEPTQLPTASPTETAAVATSAKGGRLDMQQQVDRLSRAVDALNSRLDQRFPLPEEMPATSVDSGTGVSGGAILLGFLGVIVGWLMGATYQRNKDRGRRSRIRL